MYQLTIALATIAGPNLSNTFEYRYITDRGGRPREQRGAAPTLSSRDRDRGNVLAALGDSQDLQRHQQNHRDHALSPVK